MIRTETSSQLHTLGLAPSITINIGTVDNHLEVAHKKTQVLLACLIIALQKGCLKEFDGLFSVEIYGFRPRFPKLGLPVWGGL